MRLYELAYRCKEWAYINEYLLDSRVVESKGSCFIMTSPISGKEDVDKTIIADSEPQAIFKACEWILKNRKK